MSRVCCNLQAVAESLGPCPLQLGFRKGGCKSCGIGALSGSKPGHATIQKSHNYHTKRAKTLTSMGSGMPTLNLTAVSLAFLASIAMCCVGSSALPVCAFASHAPAIKLLACRKHYNHLVYLNTRAAISFFPLSTGQQLSTSTPPYLTRIECPSSCAMSSLDTLLCQSHFQVCLLQLASQRATTRATGLQGMATRPLETKALKCLRTSGGNNAQHKGCPTGS